MASDVRRLLDEADALAATADSLSRTFARELEHVLRDLERRLAGFIAAADHGARTAVIKAARANALRREIRDLLTAAGYEDLADAATSARYDRLVAHLQRLRVYADVAAFTARDYTRIQALQALARLDLLQVGDEAAVAIWRTLVQGLYSQRPVRHLLEDVADALDAELTTARTWYDTQTSVFTRQVESLKFGDASTFLYAGPTDSKLRPFCQQHVGKVYTKAAIDGLTNGQLPNVFLTGGGWNCRHTWVALSTASDLAPLADTGERVPEVTEALARLPRPAAKAA